MNDRDRHQGPPATPRATYRLQFNREFRFEDARRIVPYLAALGISHVYASPLLMARPGSMHGYDIVSHDRLNPEIGTDAEFDALVGELHRHGMGLIIDIVPNHMGIGPDNPWWMDVLEWGRASPSAKFFDIEWEPLEPTLAGKVLLPVLGDHYGAVLERGELRLGFDPAQGTFTVSYFGTPFPIAPRDYPVLLERAAAQSVEAAGDLEAAAIDLKGRLAAGRNRSANAKRRQAIAEAKNGLAALVAENGTVGPAIDAMLDQFNGKVGEPASFDLLHRLLERQAYRLAFWRVAAHEINYRRFFDINELAGLRIEEPELFEASHRLIRTLVAEGKVQGLRLDHVDGLRDPKSYFERLQRLATDATGNAAEPGFYVLIEKILAPHERLRPDWAVDGTTGYEFMAEVNELFVDPVGERPMTRLYEKLVDRTFDFEEMVVAAKYQIMREALASELDVLANKFNKLAKRRRNTRDYSLIGLREALASVVANFPVYRTYVTAKGAGHGDLRDLDWAIGKARQAAMTPDTSIYDFIREVLTLTIPARGQRAYRADALDAALKFQQYTGPVMAKAKEDTVFYRYVRLISLNDVGSEPDRFGMRVGAFHDANRQRQRDHPRSMLATATHDHKRGEDVRARLNVLSEMPQEWSRQVERWRRFNARKRHHSDGRSSPSRNDEYLFYQTVVGAWPFALDLSSSTGIDAFRDRIDAYMRKAVREAKLRSSWAVPNEAYEAGLSQFVARALDPALGRPFLEDVEQFVVRIAPAGAVNGLGQITLKLMAPGVPDTYQGTEFWDLSLVDPDNRRPVDYPARQRGLADEQSGQADDLVAHWQDGRIKQHVIHRLLSLRRDHPGLFAAGDYRPLEVTGPHADRVVAFARSAGPRTVIVAAPRLVWPLIKGETLPLPRRWGATAIALPDALGDGNEVLSGRRMSTNQQGAVEVGNLLEAFPVAVVLA